MKIRNIVICLIKKGDEIFIAQGRDEVKDETFYRPLGGGIEFGELAEVAAIREFKEEMNTDIEVLSYIHTFENIFTFNGNRAHEIVILLEAKFKDMSIYELDETTFVEDDGTVHIAKWVNKNMFISGDKTLYPEGLAEYLKKC